MCVLFLHCCELHSRFVPALSITCTFTFIGIWGRLSRWILQAIIYIYTCIHDSGVPFCWDHIELFPIFILLFLLWVRTLFLLVCSKLCFQLALLWRWACWWSVVVCLCWTINVWCTPHHALNKSCVGFWLNWVCLSVFVFVCVRKWRCSDSNSSNVSLSLCLSAWESDGVQTVTPTIAMSHCPCVCVREKVTAFKQ